MFMDMVSNFAKNMAELYEKLMRKALEPYGINETNVKENAHRIKVGEHYTEYNIDGGFEVTEDIIVDGKYAFSIQRTIRYERKEPDSITAVISGKIFVDEVEKSSNDQA